MKQDEELTDSIWVIPEQKLQRESWRILLHQPTDQEVYERKQAKLLREIFE